MNDPGKRQLFTIGAKVEFTGNGPRMKVLAIDGDSVTCGWFVNGVFKERSFPAATLESVFDPDQVAPDYSRLNVKELEVLKLLMEKAAGQPEPSTEQSKGKSSRRRAAPRGGESAPRARLSEARKGSWGRIRLLNSSAERT